MEQAPGFHGDVLLRGGLRGAHRVAAVRHPLRHAGVELPLQQPQRGTAAHPAHPAGGAVFHQLPLRHGHGAHSLRYRGRAVRGGQRGHRLLRRQGPGRHHPGGAGPELFLLRHRHGGGLHHRQCVRPAGGVLPAALPGSHAGLAGVHLLPGLHLRPQRRLFRCGGVAEPHRVPGKPPAGQLRL